MGGDRSVAVRQVPGTADDRWAESVTFAAYAERWLAGFIDDSPDRARFEAALQHRLLAAIGQLPLPQVLETDRDVLYRQVMGSRGDGDDGAARDCLYLSLEDAVEDLRAGALASRADLASSWVLTRLRE